MVFANLAVLSYKPLSYKILIQWISWRGLGGWGHSVKCVVEERRSPVYSNPPTIPDSRVFAKVSTLKATGWQSYILVFKKHNGGKKKDWPDDIGYLQGNNRAVDIHLACIFVPYPPIQQQRICSGACRFRSTSGLLAGWRICHHILL